MERLTFTAHQCWSLTRETRGTALGKRRNASIRLELLCHIRTYVYLPLTFHRVLKFLFFFNILVKSRWIYSPGKDNYINNNFSNPGCYLRSGNTSIFIFFYLEIDEGVLTGSLLTLVLTIIKFRNI